MRILVTGGAGFIGSHVVDAYIKAGHEVVVLDNFSTGSWDNVHPGVVDACEVDICDRQAVREVLKDFCPDVVNHHAAMVDVIECQKNPDKACSINIDGTWILLQEAWAIGVKKFVFASSGGAIYGECPTPALETYPVKPCGVYGRSKLHAEGAVREYRKKLSTVILRYGNVYGPRGERDVISAFEEAVEVGEPLIIYGDGEQVRDFIHVEDVARANVLALEHEGIFNIATGVSTSILDLAQLIVGRRNVLHHCLPPREGEIRESRLNVSLAKEVLDFEASPL